MDTAEETESEAGKQGGYTAVRPAEGIVAEFFEHRVEIVWDKNLLQKKIVDCFIRERPLN